ncbi:hypothetical protein ACWD1W_30915 [Streptomyces olivaceoviridis]
MKTWAATARALTAAVVLGPAKDGARAGAITRSGPRWMLVGEWTSTTVISTISAIGTVASAALARHAVQRMWDYRLASLPVTAPDQANDARVGPGEIGEQVVPSILLR